MSLIWEKEIMNIKDRLTGLVLIMVILSLTGCGMADQKDRETVNGYYVQQDIGETKEGMTAPEDAVDDLPEGIELQENETYIGTEVSTETDLGEPGSGYEDLRNDSREFVSLIRDDSRSFMPAFSSDSDQEESILGLNGKVSYYHYDSLNKEQKSVYREILKGFVSHDAKFRVDASREEIRDYYDRVMYDHPELFWVSSHFRYWDYGDYVMVEPEYNRTKSQRDRDQVKINQTVDRVLKEVSREKNQYDKVLYIFKYLIRTVDYKPDAADDQNVYSALINKATVCSGYARATQLLLQKAGIQCIYVWGYSFKGASHSWDILKMGKQYYQIDTTWGDPNYQNQHQPEIPEVLRYDYGYYCTDDKTMFKTRTQDQGLPLPSCTSMDKSFYVYNHRCFDKYNDKVRESIRKNIKDGKKYWHGQFSNKAAFEEMVKDVRSNLYGQYIYEIKGKGEKSAYIYDDIHYTIKLYY